MQLENAPKTMEICETNLLFTLFSYMMESDNPDELYQNKEYRMFIWGLKNYIVSYDDAKLIVAQKRHKTEKVNIHLSDETRPIFEKSVEAGLMEKRSPYEYVWKPSIQNFYVALWVSLFAEKFNIKHYWEWAEKLWDRKSLKSALSKQKLYKDDELTKTIIKLFPKKPENVADGFPTM